MVEFLASTLAAVFAHVAELWWQTIFIYRKILKISPGAYIFQRSFLRGLFSEGPIFGGVHVRRKICLLKLAGLACSGKEIYHFCFVLLCIGGQIPSTSPLGGLYPEGRFRGEFFPLRFWGAYIWRGLYMEGLIFGILWYILVSPLFYFYWHFVWTCYSVRRLASKILLSRQVKHTPQDSINEFIIQKLNALVVKL